MTTPEMLKFLILWVAQAVGLAGLRRRLERVANLAVAGPRLGTWSTVATWPSRLVTGLSVNVIGVPRMSYTRRGHVEVFGRPPAGCAGVDSFWSAVGPQCSPPSKGAGGGSAAWNECSSLRLT